jgi:GPH family glycoside/pentoside/hexuronide:cation symporter
MSQTQQPASSSGNRLPVSAKAAWGVGGVVDNLMMNGTAMLLLPIYNIALGVNPIWLGYAMLLPRLIDVVIDPLIGNWSDNASTRWGRRRPFIAAGGIIAAVSCILLWMPPLHLGENGLLAYSAFFITALCAGYALFSIPWSALGYELTTDFHERTRVMAWRLYFAYAGGLALPWLYKLALLPVFSPQDTGGIPNEVYGIRWVAAMVAVVCLASTLIPAWFCREPVQLVKQPHTGIREALSLTFRNGPFLLLSGVVVVVISGLILSGPFLLYLNIYYVTAGNKDLAGTLGGWSGMLGQILGFASTPLLVAMATRLGKKNAMLIGQAAAMVGYALSWVCITPAMPYLQLLPALLIYPGLNSVWLLSQSVMADICDIDELHSGKRREGMFGAAMALIFKFSMAFAPVLVGYMLFWSGFREEASTQTQSTLQAMRIFYAGIPVVCLAISMALTSFLPISERDAREVRRLLDERSNNLPEP